MNSTLLDKLYKEKEEVEAKLSKIDAEIKEKQASIYGGKVEKALSLLNEVYDAIPNAALYLIDIDCDYYGYPVTIKLSNALKEIENAFNYLIKLS